MSDTKLTLRKCIGCNEMKNRNDLIRIVRLIDKTVTIDVTHKMDGRGAYICRNKSCLDNAVKRKAFNRALKSPVPSEVINSLYLEIENGD